MRQNEKRTESVAEETEILTPAELHNIPCDQIILENPNYLFKTKEFSLFL